MILTGFICLIVGFVLGVLMNNSSRVPGRPSHEIINEFKKSAEFSRIMDEYADNKVKEAKRTGEIGNAFVTKESFVTVSENGARIVEKTNRPDFDFSNVQFYEDMDTSFSQQDIARFNENKIPSEWLRPKKNIDESNRFTGKKVVITGEFSFPRNQLAKLLWDSGADLDTSIGAKTDFVIKGENAGWRKCEQIEELGIECLSEDDVKAEFIEL